MREVTERIRERERERERALEQRSQERRFQGARRLGGRKDVART